MSQRKKKILSFLIILGLMISPMAFANAISILDLSGIDNHEAGLSDASVSDIIVAVMNWFLAIVTFLAVISFVISGILFITAGTNSGQVENAKSWLMYAVIGIVVSLSGYIIINLIDVTLQGNVQGGAVAPITP